MGRWLALAAGAAWLVAVAVWLYTGPPSPQGGGSEIQAQLWGGHGAPLRVATPDLSGDVCLLEQVDRAHASTLSCMSCHDGSAGPGLEYRSGSGALGKSHPVDVNYGTAYARQPTRYVPPGALPPDVPLVEGKVACTSCHDAASTEPGHVARPEGLCNACHVI